MFILHLLALSRNDRELADSQLRGLKISSVSPQAYTCKKHETPTPKGVKVNVLLVPVQAGFVGGAEAKVSPAVGQLMGHAVTVMLKGDLPESNMGLGSEVGELVWNCNVAGSMAYCQAAVASNSRSTARGCWAFVARTFWLLGTVKRFNHRVGKPHHLTLTIKGKVEWSTMNSDGSMRTALCNKKFI